MIRNRDIIIFNDDWGRYPSTLQHIATVLMRNNNRVFWIGSVGLRKPKFSYADFIRAFQKIKKMFSKPEDKKEILEETPVLIFPFIIPYHDLKFVRSFNMWSIARSVKKVLAGNNAVNPILLTSAPVSDGIIGKLGESCSVFYCVDDYSAMERAFKCIPETEKKLVDKADAVFAVSDHLLKTRISPKGETHFAPQGVQTHHFKKTELLNEKVRNIGRPVIGFFGLISEWIDLDLIYDCAIAYPGYNFVMIGKSLRDLNRFNDCRNFTYLGGVDYSVLPEYASVFDVGIIPFELNDITIPTNPLKLLEYFSLGIPVVSTNLPEAKKFGDLCFVAKDNKEFVNLLPEAVKDNSAERNKLRIAKAAEFSWESVAEKVFDTVLRIEAAKKSGVK